MIFSCIHACVWGSEGQALLTKCRLITRSEVSTTGGILPKLTLHEVMRKVQFGTFGPVTLELRNDII